jgi:hypothetical protein
MAGKDIVRTVRFVWNSTLYLNEIGQITVTVVLSPGVGVFCDNNMSIYSKSQGTFGRSL